MLLISAMLSIIGFLVSVYALSVERRIARDAAYKPYCDVSSYISCSEPILSPYGALFGFSNAIAGIWFYAVTFLCAMLHWKLLLLFLNIIAVLVSSWLAYVLFFKIRRLCIICIALYAINGALLVASLLYV